jgi:type IV pilus assembly protein PilM
MLPLGIDIGATRVRVALVSEVKGGGTRIHHVVVRDLPSGASSAGPIASPEIVADILRDAVSEVSGRERRCVASISNDAATIKPVTFPQMSHFERSKAAKFEASRFVRYPLDDCTVRLASGERTGDYFLGIARSSALRSRVKVLRGAGLRPLAVDHEACAWRRAAGSVDCLVDVGFVRSTVIVLSHPLADVRTFAVGGETITSNIARALGIDRETAEERKRTVFQGASRAEIEPIVSEIADRILEVRSAGHSIRRIGLAGNGARLEGLAAALERATGIAGGMVEFPSSVTSDYPLDVLRAAAPDWLFCYGITLWSVA